MLHQASAEFPTDQITLIVGPSGVGKSLLLKLIAGIMEPNETGIQANGEILIDGKTARAGQAGVVFQSFALFDELSPLQNVDFARANGGRLANRMTSRQLLDKLHIPLDVPTSRLAGGRNSGWRSPEPSPTTRPLSSMTSRLRDWIRQLVARWRI